MFFTTADIGDSFQQTSDQVFTWLPRLVGALVILLVFYVLARIVRKVIGAMLQKSGLDRASKSGKYGEYVAKYASGFTPSKTIGAIGFWFVFLTGALLSLSTLGIEALDNAIAGIVAYLPNVIAAVLIVVAGLAIAGAIGGGIAKLMGDTALGKIAASIVPVLVLTVTMFMALVQLKIAVPIVTGMFYIVLGGIALAAALAFGLGGRNAAQRLLDGAYEKGQEALPQVKEEAALAKERLTDIKDDAKAKLDEGHDDQPMPSAPFNSPPAPGVVAP